MMNQNPVGIGSYATPVSGDCGCGAATRNRPVGQDDLTSAGMSIGLTLGLVALVVFPVVGYILYKESQEA